MKNQTTLLLLSLLWLVNCSNKETKQDKETSTTNKQAKEEQIFDLDGKVFWEGNGASIKIIEENKPKTLFLNFESIDDYGFKKIKLEGNKTGQIVSGKISSFGDLNQDGTPEFIIDDITESNNAYFGYRMILNIAASKIKILKSVRINVSQKRCSNIVGEDFILEYDSLLDGGPYLIQKSKFGFLEGEDCKNYEQAVSTTYYSFQENLNELKLVDRSECPIENNVINLATLYSINENYLSNYPFQNIHHWYDYRETIAPKFNACGELDSLGIEHLEKLAGLKLVGGNAQKRTDLMPHIEDEFLNISPYFIKWAREKLIPTPNQKQINGLTYGFIFRKSGKFSLDNYAKVRLLIELEDKEALLHEYTEAKATINNNSPNKETPYTGPNLILKKYDWVNSQLEKYGLEGTNHYIHYGFWMRRMLDGSEPEIWETLKYILKMYDKEWYNTIKLVEMIEIDSTTFALNKKEAQVNPIIKGIEAIPRGIVSEKNEIITINAKNGKTITYENNNTEGESLESYRITGYWPENKMILIDAMGWESASTALVDINTGNSMFLESGFYPSRNGEYIAESYFDMDNGYLMKISEFRDNSLEPIKNYKGFDIKEGFWKDGSFFFKKMAPPKQEFEGYYKIGVGFDDIQPYLPPVKDIINKSDSIPTDSSTVNIN